MLGVQTPCVMECSVNRQVDLLSHAYFLVGQSHNEKRAGRISCIVPPRLIPITLVAVEWLPGKRKSQFRSPRQSRLVVDHLLDPPGAPQIVFETGVLQNLRPQSAVNRIANRLQEASEDRPGDFVTKRLGSVNFD